METPCNKVCQIDPETQLCTGCGRTLAEISQWLLLAPPERARIMAELPLRRAGQPPETNRHRTVGRREQD